MAASLLNQPRPDRNTVQRLADTEEMYCVFGSPLYKPVEPLSDNASAADRQAYTIATGALESALIKLRQLLRQVDGIRDVHFDGPELLTLFYYERARLTDEAKQKFEERVVQALLSADSQQALLFPELAAGADLPYRLTDEDPVQTEDSDDEVADQQPTAVDPDTQFTSDDVLLLLRFCRRLNSMRMAAILSARAKADVVFIREAAKELMENLYEETYGWDEVLNKLIDIAPLLRYAAELLRGLDFHPDYIDPCVPDAELLLLLEAKAYNRPQDDDFHVTPDGLIGVNSPEGQAHRASLTTPSDNSSDDDHQVPHQRGASED